MDTIFNTIEHYEDKLNGVFYPVSSKIMLPVGELHSLTGIDY